MRSLEECVLGGCVSVFCTVCITLLILIRMFIYSKPPGRIMVSKLMSHLWHECWPCSKPLLIVIVGHFCQAQASPSCSPSCQLQPSWLSYSLTLYFIPPPMPVDHTHLRQAPAAAQLVNELVTPSAGWVLPYLYFIHPSPHDPPSVPVDFTQLANELVTQFKYPTQVNELVTQFLSWLSIALLVFHPPIPPTTPHPCQ